ncbi:MAG TPA: membrane protein insertase YidC [Candidatus Hydrogenedentes bacterium]|nr:membrane protein insertase YidC [Candidatus Hydrogenedentota bacterium]HOL75895.1 membrane protein insertase YidC [Candidatus Hydrogenedentota bacterium]HPO85696.1 membrane protein insertase YidC [Candidatus Hydrogenedentota bacterium]
MWDDDQDKSTAINQLIAIIAMTLLVVIWLQYFMPRPAPVQTPPGADSPTQSVPVSSGSSEKDSGESNAGADTWPFLPPVAETTDPAADEVVLENENLRLVFTRVGARLKKAYVKLHNYGESEVQLVPEPLSPQDPSSPPVREADVEYPLGLQFTEESIGAEVNRRRFDVVETTPQRVTFALNLPGVAQIRKTFTLADVPYVLDTAVEYTNQEPESRVLGIDRTPAFWLTWAPDVESADKLMGIRPSVVWRKEGKNTILQTSKLRPDDAHQTWDAEWIALKTTYFVVALKPEFTGAQTMAQGTQSHYRFGVAAPRFEVKPSETARFAFRLYAGPSQHDYLAAAWDTLPTTIRFFQSVDFMDKFAKVLLAILNAFYRVIPNYGIAIIALTLLVRLAMYPLTVKSMKSMKRMQMLAPEVEALKTKYKDDPQELQKKTMELYRERGVNPLGGCLPMVLQMPVFFALYRMLWCSYELRGAPFVLLRFGDYVWIRDLSQPDRLLHLPFMQHVPFLGNTFDYLNLLPILMGIAMVASQKLTPTSTAMPNDQQRLMMNIMPIFFAFICYKMAAGLNLYILTSTVLGIVQNKWMPAGKVDLETKPKPVRKKKHFYAAAQERKRRLAKEMKEASRNVPGNRGNDSSTKQKDKK